MPKKYKGIDFSADWKVVTYEGHTVTFIDAEGNVKELTGFDGYKSAAAYAAKHGGIPVRE